MKKFISKKMIIFMVVLFITSLTCYIGAAVDLYNSDFNLSKYVEWNDFNHGFRIHFDDDDFNIGWYGQSNTNGTIEKELTSTVQTISIQGNSSDITVEPYSGSTIKFDISAYSSDNKTYLDAFSRSDITDQAANFIINDGNSLHNVRVHVYIPSSYNKDVSLVSSSGMISASSLNLNTLTAKAISGDISIKSITANTLTNESTSGALDIDTSNFTKSDVRTASGDIQTNSSSLGDANVSSTSGSLNLSLNNIGNQTNLNTTSGDMSINISSVSDYKLSFNTLSGSFYGNNTYSDDQKSYSYTNGNGTRTINIKTTSGECSLN